MNIVIVLLRSSDKKTGEKYELKRTFNMNFSKQLYDLENPILPVFRKPLSKKIELILIRKFKN